MKETKKRATSQEVELMEMSEEVNKVIRSVKDIIYKTICGKATTKQNRFSIYIV